MPGGARGAALYTCFICGSRMSTTDAVQVSEQVVLQELLAAIHGHDLSQHNRPNFLYELLCRHGFLHISDFKLGASILQLSTIVQVKYSMEDLEKASATHSPVSSTDVDGSVELISNATNLFDLRSYLS